jgi:hypothetical protein
MRKDDADFGARRKIESGTGPVFFFTLKPLPGEGVTEMVSRLAATLRHAEKRIVRLMLFGSVSDSAAAEEVTPRIFGQINWPVYWVEGIACDAPIAGMGVVAFSSDRGLGSLPVIAVQCGICRVDLLFELEADARRSKPGN